MTWGHKHGSVPESSPLLNFEPGWSARRPYACQCCYSMDHFSEECPLLFMKVGGTNQINYPARTLMLKKKAAERIISLEKSTWEIPIPWAHAQPKVPASPSTCPHAHRQAGPAPRNPLSAVPESGEHDMSEDEESAVNDAQDARMSEAAPPPLDDPPFGVVDNLIKFLLLHLRKDDEVGSGLSEKYIQSLCKKHKGSLPATTSVLRSDGWICDDSGFFS